jgi:signal transduction histidine kinase
VPFPPKFDAPRWLSIARAVLAAATLGTAYLVLPGTALVFFGVLGLYLVYSLLLLGRSVERRRVLGLAALFGDTVYLLVVASVGTERLLWLASLFFLYLMTEALAFYNPLEVLVISGVTALFCAALPNTALYYLNRTVVVAGALTCGYALHRRHQSREIEDLKARAAEVEKTAEKARDQERQRIASDFHDGPLQSFISLQMRLEILRKLLDRDFQAGMEDLKELQTLAVSQVRDLRVFLHAMRPVDVDGANLVATARRIAESFQKESGIPLTFIGSSAPFGLPQEMTADVLQMIREALHNVQKHAAASRVAVTLERTERGLEIAVEDNGHGFNFAGTYSLEELELLRLGPASLKRRARSLNAEMQLESRPGRGTGLRFRIPLQ